MKRQIKSDYYDSFACIAGACSQTCCQEWKIAVDDETYQSWKSISVAGEPNRSLASRTQKREGTRVIRLDEHGRCPYLNEEKLCSLVIAHGEDILSKTCAQFPRQIHEFEDRIEYSVVSCCPEVIDQMNRSEYFAVTAEGEQAVQCGQKDCFEQVRNFMIRLLQRRAYSLENRMLMLFYLMLDMYQEGQVTAQMLAEYEQEATLAKLHTAIANMQFDAANTLVERNELFFDLVENYRKEGLYSRYLDDIAGIAERMSQEEDFEEQVAGKLLAFGSELDRFDPLFENFLASECFTNVLIPGGEDPLESMTMMLQWIAMEYAVIRHALFLRWIADGEQELGYETVRDYLVVMSRMTGYDEEDIVEYLENSFQELIWEWGYFALITGEAADE